MTNHVDQRIILECLDCGDKLFQFVYIQGLNISNDGNAHLNKLRWRMKPHTCSKES